MSGSEVWSKLGSCLRSPEAALAAIGTLTRYATYKLEDKKQDQADLMCLVKSFKEAWEKTHGKLPDVDPLAPPVGSMNKDKPMKSDSKSSDAKEKPKKEASKAKTKKGKGEGMDGGKGQWGSAYDEYDGMSGGNDEEVARLMASLGEDGDPDAALAELTAARNQEPFTGAFETFVGGFDPVGAVDNVGNAALGAITRKLDAIGQPVQGQPAPGQPVTEPMTGGNQQDLQKYGENVYIKEKERLIRSIAGDIFNMLKVKYNAKTAPIGDVVKKLRDIVPDPRSGKKFKPDFYSNSSKQKSLCHALAESINKHYGKHVLSLDEDPNELCNKAAEILYTLLTGLHSEVIAVMGDLARIIRNIELIRQFMGEAHRKMFALVQATGDQSAMMDAQSTQRLYDRFETELNRQMNLLSNNLSIVIGPTGKSLITLLESNKDFSGIVRELRADIGTSRFGDKLGYLLSGVADVAYSADVAEKALKVLGMNTGDLNRAKNLQDLRFMVDDKIAAQKPTAKEFEKLMSAAELLYRNYFPAKETKQFVGKAEGFIGGCDCMNGAGSDDEKSNKKKPGDRSNNLVINDSSNNNIMSGVNSEEHQSDVHQEASDPSAQAPSQAPPVDVGQVPLDPAVEAKIDSMFGGYDTDEEDDPNEGLYWSKRSISKKLKKQDKFRTLLFKDFKKKLKSDYRMLVDSINLIAPHIGSTIPISDDLDKFIKLLNTVPTLNEEQIAEILSGYKKDVLAKEKRNNILSSFRSLLIVLEPLLKSHHAHFNDIALSIKRIMDDINDFGEKFLKAITEIHIETPDELRRAVQRTATSIFGSGEREDEVGSFVAFDKAKRDIYYYYKIATIRTDLDRAAKETASFGEGYEEMIGEEAAWLINKIRERFDKLINDADPKNMSGKKATKLRDTVGLSDDERKRIFEAYSYMMKRQRDAKVKMVEVAQAIDLYLKAFTDGIAQHPNELKSIVKILDQVEIVAKWYNEKSGDNLATLFEAFPQDLNDDGKNPNTLNRTVEKSTITPLVITPESDNVADNRHYYKILADRYMAGRHLPGNPFIGIETQAGGKNIPTVLFGQVEKSVKGIRALENILSCFKSIGERFGGIDPQAKTFMNPGQIFNALNEYIVASSLTCGFAQNISGIALGRPRGISEFMTGGDDDDTKYPGLRPRQNMIYPGSSLQLQTDPDPIVNTLANAYTPMIDPLNPGSISHLSNAYGLHQSNAAHIVAPPHQKDPDATYGVVTGIINPDKAHGLFDIAMSAVPSTEMKSTVIASGVNNRYVSEDPDAYVKLAQTGDSEYKTYDLAGWVNRFADTDHLFMMVMKSIAAKILTVIDVYRVFNRPVNTEVGDPNNLRTMDLNSGPLGATRTMLGGAEKRPQVVPDALELYVRLPLLAEWYREKFNFRRQDVPNSDKRVVSMVPNIDGIWSTFIKIIFDSAEYVKEGSYNEGQVNGLITEINEIYKAYKQRYPTSTVRQVINAFVTEINRIFGFLKKKEIDKYLESRRLVYTESKETKLDETLDYDILDAEDQFMRRPAPSDKYITYKSNEKKRTETRLAELHKAIIEFRQEMDKDFTAHARDVSRYSFVENLREQRKELDLAANDEEKYQVVVKAIQGLNKFNKLGTEKLLMIHEMVAAPLALIYSIYTWLKDYNDFAHGNNFANVKEWLRTMDPATLPNQPDLIVSYRTFLEGKYPHVRPASRLEAVATHFVNLLEPGLLGPMIAPGAGNPRNLATNLRDSHNRYFNALVRYLLSFVSHNHQLTSVHITEDGKLIAEWNGLESLVMDLLSQVRYNIEKLKPNFTQPDILGRFESHTNVGSLFWLEENLVEILFKNRDRSGLPESNEGLSSLWTHLMSGKFSSDDAAPPTPVNYDTSLAKLIYFSYNEMNTHRKYQGHYKILGNDMKTFPFNILPFTMLENDLRTQGETDALRSLRRSINDQSGRVRYAAASPAGANELDPNDIPVVNSLAIAPSRLLTYNVEGGVSNWFADDLVSETQNGLLLKFNEILARYLYHCIDPATLKIYPPLIEGFANGHASAAVMKNVALPDILKLDRLESVRAHLGNLGNPAAGCNIWASLAQTMRTLLTNIDIRLKKKKHLFENLQEVPEHLKEKMRASLPTFSKLLEMINIRAQFFVNLITKTGLKDKINQVARAGSNDLANESKPGVSLPLVPRGALSSAEKARWYNSRLQDISNLALGLKKDCDRVYNELQDVPLYLETYRDSIRDFKARHHVLPVMPLSSLLLVTDVEPYLRDDLLLPTLVGTDSFRYNYGTRLVINRYDIEPSLDHMPGVKDVLNMYNSVANKASYFDPAHYNRFAVNFVRLTRATADLSVFNCWFDRTNYVRRLPALVPGAALPLPTPTPYQLQINMNLASVLNITENQNVKDSRIKLSSTMGLVNLTEMVDRQKLRVCNILDMNIVPINVNAFIREVPFVNILNYSYTFDRLVRELLQPSKTQALVMIKADPVQAVNKFERVFNTRELYAKLLSHPYVHLTSREYYDLFYKLCVGATLMDLGRPRFLSDQLWNKVLLNTMIAPGDIGIPYQEGGPAAEVSRREQQLRRDPYNEEGLRHYLRKPAYAVPGVGAAVGARRARIPLANTRSFGYSSTNPQIEPEVNQYFQELGRVRFDTKLVRNLTWFVNLQRLIRALAKKHLSFISTPVVRGIKMLDDKVTEYHAHDQFNDRDYDGDDWAV